MKIEIGDTVIAIRNVNARVDGSFELKQKVVGTIVCIPSMERFAVIDTGLYKESFPFCQLRFIKRGEA